MGAFLSVIVPSRNRRAGLLRLLDSLVAQAGEVDFEVIAVLDGSTDGSAGALRGRPWPFPLSVIEQEHRGAGAARNAGTREASGEVCVFVDDDVVLDPAALVSFAEAHAGADVPSCILGSLSMTAVHGGLPRAHVSIWERLTGRLASDGVRRPSDLYSGLVSMPRDIAARFEFREDLPRLEDNELGERLHAHGVPLRFAAAAKGRHTSGKTTRECLADTRVGGTVAVRLFREREAPGPDRSPGPRTHRRAPVIALALLAGRIPLPVPIASLLGAIPNRVPGSRWLFEAMSMHACLRGAGQELDGYREWKAFLTRPRPGTTESS